jgi:hypothetical protein
MPSSPGTRRSKDNAKSPESELEAPVPMFLDPEDPLSWEEKFGNNNLSRFGDDSVLTCPPVRVRPVKRLEADVRALLELTSSEDPPHRSVRPGQQAHAIYGFGDASKDGFGVSVEIPGKRSCGEAAPGRRRCARNLQTIENFGTWWRK